MSLLMMYSVLLICVLQVVIVYSQDKVRLSDFTLPNDNFRLVEVFGESGYGYVCGWCWTSFNANVTCKGLGYSGGMGSLRPIQISNITIDYLIGQYICDGTESDLGSCRWTNTPCSPCDSFAVVKCDGNSLVDGGWSSWGSYGPCSVMCGEGIQIRTRTCDNPAPVNSGRECTGGDQENKICTNVECPIDGGWSRWSNFGPCSVTCGQGHQNRTRTCGNPTPQHGGQDCVGYDRGVTPCSNGGCQSVIIAVVAACAGLLVTVAVIFLIKRKRLTQAKPKDDSKQQPLSVTYSKDAIQVVHRRAPDNNHYSIVAGTSEDTNHYSEGTAGPSTDTDNYGCGLLGKTGSRSVRIGEEDMYSHTKPGQPLDDGYDVFVKKKDTVDESGIYDHAGNCMAEGEYDSFQYQKGSCVENDYSQFA
ncbi:uncharacterized protein [Argopecten irradians]|uniref:uncharacterized protein isoform X2 n=1 Tax=Argopecten irradians TaxID=31199 RepID=UPI0037172B41